MSEQFDELLAKHLEGRRDYVGPVEAQRFRDFLREHYPEVLDAWLAENEVRFILGEIGRSEHSNRNKARRRAGARQFDEAAQRAEQGDLNGLTSMYENVHVIDEKKTRRRVADMVGADHRFLATHTYGVAENTSRLLKEFHLAVAKKVGRKRTADVMPVEQYEELYRSITEQAA